MHKTITGRTEEEEEEEGKDGGAKKGNKRKLIVIRARCCRICGWESAAAAAAGRQLLDAAAALEYQRVFPTRAFSDCYTAQTGRNCHVYNRRRRRPPCQVTNRGLLKCRTSLPLYSENLRDDMGGDSPILATIYSNRLVITHNTTICCCVMTVSGGPSSFPGQAQRRDVIEYRCEAGRRDGSFDSTSSIKRGGSTSYLIARKERWKQSREPRASRVRP